MKGNLKKSIIKSIVISTLLLPTFSFADDFSEFDDFSESSEKLGWSFSGFVEIEQGMNVGDKGVQDEYSYGSDYVLANRKFRLQSLRPFRNGGFFSKLDFYHDEVTHDSDVDIRELRLQYRLTDWLDLSMGRQVSTWGVADMLFINDLFPKNWQANFQGRDMEMLKDPSNTLRLTSYFNNWTLDFVYTPEFTPDTVPTGCRFGVYDPNSSQVVVNKSSCGDYHPLDENGKKLEEDEIALSLKRRVLSQDMALYFYDGFYKSPKGIRSDNGVFKGFHPKLRVYGISSEGQIGNGIFSFESGYYDSLDDKEGDNFLIENSKVKYLVGYRFDLSAKLSLGFQWYMEQLLDYDRYEESIQQMNSSLYQYRRKEFQNTFTTRITYKTMQDTLVYSLFTYIRPQDEDSLTKFEVSKKITDSFKIVGGINIFSGKENYRDREFGMLKNDDNAFIRINFSF